MAKFRKKPIEIEAISSENLEEVQKLFSDILITENSVYDKFHGWVNYRKGDIIIKGLQGEYYPCDPDIFKESYEEI